MKKRVPFFLFVLGLCVTYGSVVFSAPAFGPGEYLDPPCAPGTTYLGDDCTTAVLGIGNDVWDGTPGAILFTGASGLAEAPTDFFWDETDSRLGIGTDTPTKTLDLVGDTLITSSVIAVSAEGILPVNEFNTTITAASAISDSSYRGLSSSIAYSGVEDLDFYTGSLGYHAPLIGLGGEVIVDSVADVAGATAGQFIATHSGSGTMNGLGNDGVLSGLNAAVISTGGDVHELAAISATSLHLSSSDVYESSGINFRSYNAGSGDITNAFALQARLSNAGSGTITYATGLDVMMDASAGSITDIRGMRIKIVPSAGTIDYAKGIDFGAGVSGVTNKPGISATGDVIGLSFTSYTNITTEASLAGNNVYALYFNDDDSLQGVINEYALYIGDTDAENWFSNGFRVGTDDDTYKISSTGLNSLGGAIGGSSILYIGNQQIDTSVSDRRLKTNIADPEQSALDFIDQFDVVQFDWLPENNRSQYGTMPFGLIAQDVAELAPEYASIPEDPDSYMAVRFNDMVPMLIKAIQELRDDIAANATAVVNSVQDFVVDTFTARRATVTEEFCVGSVCVNESEFAELVDQIRDESESQGSDDEEDVPFDESDDKSDAGDIPSDEPEDVGDDEIPVLNEEESILNDNEDGQSEPVPEPELQPEPQPEPQEESVPEL